MKRTAALIVAVLVSVIIVVAWVARFRYEATSQGQIVRINRFTSQVCYSQPDGTWNSNMHPTGLTKMEALKRNLDELKFESELQLDALNKEGLKAKPVPSKPLIQGDVPNTCK